MATSIDPAFGAGFDADAFRDAIRSAMNMGLPENLSERATFQWKTKHSYTVGAPSGNPYDFSTTPETTTVHADVQIPVAVEAVSSLGNQGGGTPIGEFDTPRMVLTVLDESYEQVKTADMVLLGGNTYFIQFWAPPMGLFDVTFYQCHIMAEDET
jgi:hypothetical protein